MRNISMCKRKRLTVHRVASARGGRGGKGVPTLDRGVPTLGTPILTWLGEGVPTLPRGVPTLGYPHPDLAEGRGTYLGVPPSPILTWLGGGATYLARAGGTYLGVAPPPILTWPRGREHLPWIREGGTYLGRGGVPLGTNRQTPVKTVPSRRTTYAVGKNEMTTRSVIGEQYQFCSVCWKKS